MTRSKCTALIYPAFIGHTVVRHRNWVVERGRVVKCHMRMNYCLKTDSFGTCSATAKPLPYSCPTSQRESPSQVWRRAKWTGTTSCRPFHRRSSRWCSGRHARCARQPSRVGRREARNCNKWRHINMKTVAHVTGSDVYGWVLWNSPKPVSNASPRWKILCLSLKAFQLRNRVVCFVLTVNTQTIRTL